MPPPREESQLSPLSILPKSFRVTDEPPWGGARSLGCGSLGLFPGQRGQVPGESLETLDSLSRQFPLPTVAIEIRPNFFSVDLHKTLSNAV